MAIEYCFPSLIFFVTHQPNWLLISKQIKKCPEWIYSLGMLSPQDSLSPSAVTWKTFVFCVLGGNFVTVMVNSILNSRPQLSNSLTKLFLVIWLQSEIDKCLYQMPAVFQKLMFP